jgi:hypothetical protein
MKDVTTTALYKIMVQIGDFNRKNPSCPITKDEANSETWPISALPVAMK